MTVFLYLLPGIEIAFRGCFNTSLLRYPEFDSSKENSPMVLWEKGKTILTGKIISYAYFKKNNANESKLKKKD